MDQSDFKDTLVLLFSVLLTVCQSHPDHMTLTPFSWSIDFINGAFVEYDIFVIKSVSCHKSTILLR